jgi:hypothetical protein
MAKDTSLVGEDTVEWETLSTGSLGQEWDFDRDGPLVGHFRGSRTVPTEKVESGEATAYLFSPVNAPDSEVFVWGSSEIAAAFAALPDGSTLIREGDLVRIAYLGRDQFTGADGKPRQIKRFKVQVPKA